MLHDSMGPGTIEILFSWDHPPLVWMSWNKETNDQVTMHGKADALSRKKCALANNHACVALATISYDMVGGIQLCLHNMCYGLCYNTLCIMNTALYMVYIVVMSCLCILYVCCIYVSYTVVAFNVL